MSKKSRRARKSSRKVGFETTPENLTSQAGLVPMVKFTDRIDLDGTVSELVDHERGANAVYSLTDAVVFSSIGIAGGARSMDAIARVCSDPVLMKAANWERVLDPTSLGRILKETDMKASAQLENTVHALRKSAWEYASVLNPEIDLPEDQMCVDIDSTVKTVFGNQEGAEKGYNPTAKGKLSYHPQLAFCSHTKEVLQGWLRPGSAYTSNGIVEFYQQLRAQIDKQIRLIIRADSGYFVGTFLDECEANGDGYLVKVKLKNLSALLGKQEWTEVDGQPGWEQAKFEHRCNGWSQSRTFLAVRREKESEPNAAEPAPLFEVTEYDYFCYVTSEDLTPWQTHKDYGKRATCETWIEECKNQTALAAIKTSSFWANSVLFQAAIVAYNLYRWMGLASGDATLRKMEPATARCFLVRVAGKLLTGARQLRIATPIHLLYPDCWNNWLRAAGIEAA